MAGAGTKSNQIQTMPMPNGQKIVRAYPRDNSSVQPSGSKQEQKMGKLGGSDTNLEHSLGGATAK